MPLDDPARAGRTKKPAGLEFISQRFGGLAKADMLNSLEFDSIGLFTPERTRIFS